MRQVVVWNKIDLTEAEPGIDRDEYGNIARVRVSAITGDGFAMLRETLAEYALAKADARRKELAAVHQDEFTIT
jgi:GTP-binding protein HflX